MATLIPVLLRWSRLSEQIFRVNKWRPAEVKLPGGMAAKRSRLDRVSFRQGSNADAGHCTRGFENAHRTILRELLYPWHPWFGKLVAIHEPIDKEGGVIFPGTL